MSRLRVCFEIDGLAEDEHGQPCPAGMRLDLGKCRETISYEELTANVDIQALLELLCLDNFSPAAVHFITPEEFDRKYGADE